MIHRRYGLNFMGFMRGKKFPKDVQRQEDPKAGQRQEDPKAVQTQEDSKMVQAQTHKGPKKAQIKRKNDPSRILQKDLTLDAHLQMPQRYCVLHAMASIQNRSLVSERIIAMAAYI